MSISYPVSVPSYKFKRVMLQDMNAVAMLRSPFTFQTQVQQHSGQIWLADVSLKPMERDEADEWTAFLLSLMGQYGTFQLGDPLAVTPRGVASGTPRINGAGQTGNVLVTDGWSTGVTGIMKKGDYFQIGQRLHRMLKDVNSDGSGNATLDMWPRIRETPADNDFVTVSSAKGLFRLIGVTQPIQEADEGKLYGVSFSAIEAI